ncbi:hypothetical protein BGZ97_000741 [Linnemannia gamsii]|uniref:Uncharacterized protein n=1 Tax=Linnemannia gamsii TaxID=64522 RepID=A0A9P6RI00_9FUNG|nr:hypothetical protein BGZ97_000741 [Linnemannia gamsii]
MRPTLAANKITATAPNESQQPAVIVAQGSIATTTAKAQAKTTETATRRALANDNATINSINKARCAGMPNPASPAYSNPAAAPATAATRGAANHSGQ